MKYLFLFQGVLAAVAVPLLIVLHGRPLSISLAIIAAPLGFVLFARHAGTPRP